jgi:hypothetical protein
LSSGQERPHVNWSGLLKQELSFLAIEHGFRLITEPGTRAGGFGLGQGYLRSTGSLHGWSDGDPFYVNYVGHPMQGGVAGFIWESNDPGYNNVEFGQNAAYWKAKLRGTAFAWAPSEQFEIGPLSEASIGQIQRDYPQQGFVDHVITPVMGLSWTLAEDDLDRYLIKRIEDRTRAPWLRILLRTGLNPSRSFANVLGMRAPWQRNSRDGVFRYAAENDRYRALREERKPAQLARDVSTFEFATEARYERFTGGGPACMGGGASAAWRLAPEWMLVAEVGGCKFTGLETNLSGDSLSYLLGPRWTPSAAGRWSPYVQVLVGGNKITHEQTLPDKKRALELVAAQTGATPPTHDDYTIADESNGFAVAAGTGIDLKLGQAVVLRVASVEYSLSYVSPNRA